jgi:hypothetical protein
MIKIDNLLAIDSLLLNLILFILHPLWPPSILLLIQLIEIVILILLNFNKLIIIIITYQLFITNQLFTITTIMHPIQFFIDIFGWSDLKQLFKNHQEIALINNLIFEQLLLLILRTLRPTFVLLLLLFYHVLVKLILWLLHTLFFFVLTSLRSPPPPYILTLILRILFLWWLLRLLNLIQFLKLSHNPPNFLLRNMVLILIDLHAVNKQFNYNFLPVYIELLPHHKIWLVVPTLILLLLHQIQPVKLFIPLQLWRLTKI